MTQLASDKLAPRPGPQTADDVELRARASGGTSADVIYRVAAAAIARRAAPADESIGSIFDIGCGTGALRSYLQLDPSDRYVGVDVVRYDALPADAEFRPSDLDTPRWPIDDAVADVSVSVETIEHLENPRAFFRELARITKPGGLIVVTTPNQLSLLSKLALVVKNQFMAFQERPGQYPAHRTALLEIDLIHIARECGLTEIEVTYTNRGRIPGTAWHWPARLGMTGRTFSDNVCLSARKPAP